jgi:hypothetical protein
VYDFGSVYLSICFLKACIYPQADVLSVTTLQHYARIVDQKVGDDMKILADKLKGNRSIVFTRTP